MNGATGAIGSAAVQLLKERGAVVTAVCDTPSIELVRGLGADRLIDRTVTDFTRDEERYEAVVDAVGKSTFGRCRRLLEPHGQYLSTDLGPYWMNPLLAVVTRNPLTGRKGPQIAPDGLNRELRASVALARRARIDLGGRGAARSRRAVDRRGSRGSPAGEGGGPVLKLSGETVADLGNDRPLSHLIATRPLSVDRGIATPPVHAVT